MSFREYCVERERRATAAQLPRYVTESSAPPQDALRIANDWSSDLFDGAFYVTPPQSQRPSCALVFVQSADGNTVASDPSTLGGGETDKHLVYEGLSRVAADAVLAGAETVRGGRVVFSVWHPRLVELRASLGKPRHPVQIVATLRGMDLSRGLMFNSPELEVILITVPAVAGLLEPSLRARPWIKTVTMSGATDLHAAFAHLRAMQIGILSCVGGRTLARALLDAGLVDDLYLTTAARPGGEPDTPLFVRQWPATLALRKHGTGNESGVIFEHLHAGPAL